MEIKVVKEDQTRVFMDGPEVCREYAVTGKITFGSSTLLPGQTGAVDPGHPALFLKECRIKLPISAWKKLWLPGVVLPAQNKINEVKDYGIYISYRSGNYCY